MTHGVTNRMTGGGTGRCLQTTEAGGMGEGWSDAMAEYASTVYLTSSIILNIVSDGLRRSPQLWSTM